MKDDAPIKLDTTRARDKHFLLIADLHSGHRFGLTPPAWWSPEFEAFQRPLWEGFQDLVKQAPWPIDGVIVDGDAVDGPGHKDNTEHLTTNVKEQGDIAIECLEWIDSPVFLFAYGTPYHTVGSFSYEEYIAQHFADRGKDGRIADTLKILVNDRHINVRHIVGRSDTAYGQATQAFKEVIRDQARAELYDDRVSDLLVRAHVHYEFKVGRDGHHVQVLPCLKLPLEILGRKLRTWYYDVGITWLTVQADGRIFTDPVKLQLKVLLPRDQQEWIRL